MYTGVTSRFYTAQHRRRVNTLHPSSRNNTWGRKTGTQSIAGIGHSPPPLLPLLLPVACRTAASPAEHGVGLIAIVGRRRRHERLGEGQERRPFRQGGNPARLDRGHARHVGRRSLAFAAHDVLMMMDKKRRREMGGRGGRGEYMVASLGGCIFSRGV